MRAAVASCHVERLLDDDVWTRYSALVRARPAGFRIAALVRPPDGEDEARWLERARTLDAPFGLHTHWTSPSHARPTDGNTAARVRRDLDWLAAQGLTPRYFSGGGWYTDDDVRAVVADAGLVDLTATTFPLPYGGGRVVGGPEKDLLPATHTIGMLARSIRLPDYVHVYFHDTDLLDRRRRALLGALLPLLARVAEPTDLDALRVRIAGMAPAIPWADVARF